MTPLALRAAPAPGVDGAGRFSLGPDVTLTHFHADRPWREGTALACRTALDPLRVLLRQPPWRVLLLRCEAGEGPALREAARNLDAGTLAAITAFLVDKAEDAGLLEGPAYPALRDFLAGQVTALHPLYRRWPLEGRRQGLAVAPLAAPVTLLCLGAQAGRVARSTADPLAPDLHSVVIDPPEPEAAVLAFTKGRLLRFSYMPGQAHDEGLHAPIATLSTGLPLPITRLMLALWHLRPDLQALFPLMTQEGRSGFLSWCLLEGARVYPALLDAPGWTQAGIAAAVYQARPDLQAAFDLRQPEGAEGFALWRKFHGGREVAALAVPALHRAPQPEMGGVSIIGHASAALGIGEDARQAAGALQAAGLPVDLVDMPPGGGPARPPRYRSVLVCLTGFDLLDLLAKEGEGFFADRKVIGLLPWELPHWPASLRLAYAGLDEIWAMSDFLARVWRREAPVPVLDMPPAVTADLPAQFSRAGFGLPEKHYLFHAGFDARSTLSRKNPAAAVQAFQRAFPTRQSVGLVLKAMNGAPDIPGWAGLQAAIAGDPRIHLLNRTEDRLHANALLACCDAHVSLHRAEGFGRIPAEALLLGKPVIATGWSGTADFVTPETGFPVDSHLIPVQDYPHCAGQFWAEPDIDHAARLMRWVAGNRRQAQRIAAAGQALMRAQHDPAVVGQRYRARLESLGWL
ncbi:MAG: hypothetical protein KJ904_02325 [Alphaproteobacteria bacterium]|nr:hypothetical protein [Alphaproteobacteria bacterium]MBU0798710.1 hypothetical protein [Alphaproteobacteria bacterium]MBU0885973.1 hypothetical protein [Alphaproteobacteria bacterium]MBU1811962.1 hypothetical protein [Alphaproteobacteria bacterium]